MKTSARIVVFGLLGLWWPASNSPAQYPGMPPYGPGMPPPGMPPPGMMQPPPGMPPPMVNPYAHGMPPMGPMPLAPRGPMPMPGYGPPMPYPPPGYPPPGYPPPGFPPPGYPAPGFAPPMPGYGPPPMAPGFMAPMPPGMVMGPYGPMAAPTAPNPNAGGPGAPVPGLDSGAPVVPEAPILSREGEPPLSPGQENLGPEVIMPALPRQGLGHKGHGHPHHGEEAPEACPSESCPAETIFPGYDIGRAPSHGHGHEPIHGCCTEFPKGSCTFQIMGGYYTNSVIDSGNTRYTFAPYALRFGKVCCSSHCNGAFEPILELNGASVLDGPGSNFFGTSLLLRYNFVKPCHRLVPYIQAGAGVQYNDAYKTPTQTILGQALEYSFQGQVGLRFMFKPNLSLDIEGGYIHLTNFGQADRNDGVNALGGSIGITYYLRHRRGCY